MKNSLFLFFTFCSFLAFVSASEEQDNEKESSFVRATLQSLSVTVVSELGDKTFFIAAIMAMKNLRSVVFIGAAGALIIMTALSVAMGFATTIIPRVYTYYASVLLFFIFGLKMLKEAWEMTPDEAEEELEEVSNEIQKKEEDDYAHELEGQDPEDSARSRNREKSFWKKYIPPVMVQTFVLTFVGEWGDRSQITTIALASRENPWGVAVGGFIGHSGCTALAVFGGRMLAQKISVRTVTFVGGVLFLGFAVAGLLSDPNGEGFDFKSLLGEISQPSPTV